MTMAPLKLPTIVMFKQLQPNIHIVKHMLLLLLLNGVSSKLLMLSIIPFTIIVIIQLHSPLH
jgi:hypothetical protein